MPKTKLSLDEIEDIKKSKGYLSAADVQNKYNIGWGRLQKIWGANGKQDDNITLEDLINKLEIIAEENHKQTEFLSQIFNKELLKNKELEEETEELLEDEELEEETEELLKDEEKEQTFFIQNIGKQISEFKTMYWQSLGLMAVVNVVILTWKHCNKDFSTGRLTPSKPIELKTLFKKEIDPFEIN